MTLSVTPSNRDVAKTAGTTTFGVSNTGYGTMPWTAAVSSGGDWLAITSGTSGSNTGTITCSFTANTGSTPRTGKITITAAGAIGSPKVVTVTQAATIVAGQFIGVWPDGIWSWDKATNQWTKLASTSGALMVSAGKVDTDAIEDVIGVWSSGLYVRQSTTGGWIRLTTTVPNWITAGDLTNDGRDDVIGSWAGSGVYYRDSATGKWTKITNAARQLAVGNIGGTRDDLLGVWETGMWTRYSENAKWQQISTAIPLCIAAGDMTGDKRADVIAAYAQGTYYMHMTSTSTAPKIAAAAEQLAVGDLDGDGRDDLLGVWSTGVWVRYGATGQWYRISQSKPKWIATGKIAAAVQAAGALDDPMESAEKVDIIDLSKEWPGEAATEVLPFPQE
jgi:hypothetical protein